MNVANLQIQGLLSVLAAINHLLVSKGVASTEEIATLLTGVEQALAGEDRFNENLEPPQRDAVLFPVRLLLMANQMAGESETPVFTELARMVGAHKEKYGDQL
jgi:hypothetical protein